jgi:hypothetical protein
MSQVMEIIHDLESTVAALVAEQIRMQAELQDERRANKALNRRVDKLCNIIKDKGLDK